MRAASAVHRTRPILKPLDATYRNRAVPPGTVRYWSWLFAAAESRAPLLGIYALGAEWQALMDPATESSVAHLKLAWWQEEMQRLAAGSAVHPISGYLAALPRAGSVDFTPLLTAVRAASAQVSGVPLERSADLEPQSQALWGGPLTVASLLAGADVHDETSLRECTRALAAADYLSRALRDYRREARVGRVPFAIDELMAAGVENTDLIADPPPAHLRSYLDRLRTRAARYFETAAEALPPAQRSRHRHLLVLAALGREHLNGLEPSPDRRRLRRLKDMLLAWTTARRAQR
jgi:15-cis-phytoene synthase